MRLPWEEPVDLDPQLSGIRLSHLHRSWQKKLEVLLPKIRERVRLDSRLQLTLSIFPRNIAKRTACSAVLGRNAVSDRCLVDAVLMGPADTT